MGKGSSAFLFSGQLSVSDTFIFRTYTDGKEYQDQCTKLVRIGHPSRMAKTISDNATVKLNIHKHYFSEDVDAIDGNSGSPVFNEDTGVVEGIVVRTCTGKTSYLIDKNVENQCRRLKIEGFYDGGTDIVRITSIPNLVKWIDL